jgi:tungstate transport system permease protein
VELIFESFGKIFSFDRNYLDIVILSLYVSVFATLISAFVSIVIASHLASTEFYGKNLITLTVNTLMSIPPVVVGLILYIVFSASGVLGFMDILYSPTIMIIAQFIIVTPIIISLSLKSLTEKYEHLGEYLVSLNASRRQIKNTIIYESRFNLLIIVITGLSRALSEVGAVIIVGGNIDNLTRVMTTSIVLETSRGELSLALSLGISLLSIALIMNILVSSVKSKLL